MVSFPDGADQALADAEFDRFISEQARHIQHANDNRNFASA